jgi:hypothetical protein
MTIAIREKRKSNVRLMNLYILIKLVVYEPPRREGAKALRNSGTKAFAPSRLSGLAT